MANDTIIIELKCACGKVCGTLEIQKDHPAGNDLSKHGIEKVECDDCKKKA